MANIRVSSDSSGWLGFTLSFHMIVDVKEIPVPCTSLQPTCHFLTYAEICQVESQTLRIELEATKVGIFHILNTESAS